MSKFFPGRPEVDPKIYAYTLPDDNTKTGWLKVGYSTGDVHSRILQQTQTANVRYELLLEESTIRDDGSSFTDHPIHKYLEKRGVLRDGRSEWFKCDVEQVRAAILAIKTREENEEGRTETFGMRPEQVEAVERTANYFTTEKTRNPASAPRFLWNAKMRFGKTFTAYQLAKKMGWKKILVMTFKPAVENAWEEDLRTHVDFTGWQFLSRNTLDGVNFYSDDKPLVFFGSFQDLMGRNSAGGIKAKNKWVHDQEWDCVILDEYHFGAWREGAKSLFGTNEKEEGEVEAEYKEGLEYYDEDLVEEEITTGAFLYLSGTPFRAIADGEFIEDQIYNWTYSDEQRAKENWNDADGPNPYASLPRMVMMTYKLPDHIAEVAEAGQFNEFDLNTFFKAEGRGNEARFIYEDEVQKWLDLIRGSGQYTTVENLKLGKRRPPMPYSHGKLLQSLTHTLWFLPSVASCHAMENLLKKENNTFYHDYKVIVAAGVNAGIGKDALPPVLLAMDNPLETKTITLTCGKLTTGVSVAPWTGIFMLRSTSSPETYFQSAFRVQTPWTIKDDNDPNNKIIIKEECYVFDFALNRALRQVMEYSDGLSVGEASREKKVEEFIHFLPVLAYDGSSMHQIDAAGVLDYALSGTTATLLARRWESALLVNVDNAALERLMANEEAMKALMSIEGFRSLNQDIEAIINKSEKVKKVKGEANSRELTQKEKRELSEDEKEYKSKRKEIQEKLIKFATRIPVFMYLTDYREEKLTDIITQLEPGLFKRVTGLTVRDFELLTSLGLFNASHMDDAVWKFRRYEDPSLEYAGVNRHEGERVGLYSTVVNAEEYIRESPRDNIFYNEE